MSVTAALKLTRTLKSCVRLSAADIAKLLNVTEAAPACSVPTSNPPSYSATRLMFAELVIPNVIEFKMVLKLSASDAPPPSRIVNCAISISLVPPVILVV